VQQELVQSEGFDPDRVVVIENGVDTDHYASGRSARVELGFPPGAVVVGGVGRLSAEKGFHHLIESVAAGRRRGLPLSLVLAGDGPERTRLERQAQALHLDGDARFLGMCSDPRPVYQAMDIFALPSLEEGSPNALLEAMASERAVVATAVGGVAEIVEHERSGLLVQPRAPRLFADALARLVADPDLRQKLRREAKRRVVERFDVSRMVDNHAALYRDLLLAR
jgi:glycosyltransferase involved in cell wall biosynthesis